MASNRQCNSKNILMKKSYPFLFFLLLFLNAESQSITKPDTLALLLDYSRPGNQHALLGSLAGAWQFQDTKRPYVNGTLVRKPLYDGRFFMQWK